MVPSIRRPASHLTPGDAIAISPLSEDAQAWRSPSIFAVLRSHLRLIAATLCLSFVLAAVYLTFARRVYQASASLLLDSGISATADASRGATSDNYNQNRSDEVRSQPVLRRAAEAGGFGLMATFADVRDPVTALQRGAALSVAAGRRSDVITVSFASPYPDDARRVVDAIVNAYLEERVTLRTAVARDVGGMIEKERADLDRRRADCQTQLALAARQSGVASLGDPLGNDAIKRSLAISDAVTSAELRRAQLYGQREATASLLDAPDRRSDYVRALQSRGRDSGDSTYADLRQQLATMETNLAVMTSSLGERHPRVASGRRAVEDLRRRVADLELTLTRSNVEALSTEAQST
ncbi:hypothetical protein EON77_09625, partial [bacterium]